MIAASAFLARRKDRAMQTDSLPPLRPWDYLRLRRAAAGRSIADAATPHLSSEDDRANIERLLESIEQPGFILRGNDLLRRLARSYAIEPEVYVQLRDLPADRHPLVCRGCGGTDWAPTPKRDGSESTVEADGTCTACKEKAQLDARRRDA